MRLAIYERSGSGRTHHLDVRLVTAHRDLEQTVKRNEFRSDLYYRLNVFPIQLPPLRERRQDIMPLIGTTWTFFPTGRDADRVHP
jgi:formate hydrogenlyase transcriptional activator